MTEPLPAQPVLTYATPVPPHRPTSVLVLAIIGIVIASLSLLGTIATLVMFFGVQAFRTGGIFWVLPWYLVQTVMAIVLNGVLIWVSIGAIRMRPRTRVLFIRWAWAFIGWKLIEFGVAASIWLLPMLQQQPNSRTIGQVLPIILISQVAPLVLNCIYPTFVLLWMRKPHVRAAFADAHDQSAFPVIDAAPAPVTESAAAEPAAVRS